MKPDILVWIGIALLTLGCGLMWRPLAPIVLGVIFIVLGFGLDKPRTP